MKYILFAFGLGFALAFLMRPAAAAPCTHGYSCAAHMAHHHSAAHPRAHHYARYREDYRLQPAPYYHGPYAYGLFDFPPDAPGGLLNGDPRPVSQNPQQWIMQQTHDRPYSDNEPY